MVVVTWPWHLMTTICLYSTPYKNVHHGELPLQKAAMTIGRQSCGMTWVFGHIHVGANCQVIDEKESNYVWDRPVNHWKQLPPRPE